jgi:hypothetical protein
VHREALLLRLPSFLPSFLPFFPPLLFYSKQSHCLAQAALELTILLSQPPECWDLELLF